MEVWSQALFLIIFSPPRKLGENFVGFDTVTYNKSTILTYNYAYGGATIDANLVVPYLPTVLSLTDQVNQFLAGAAKKPATSPWTSTNTLFTIWIGERASGLPQIDN